MSCRKRGDSGFTLTEALAALFVLSLALTQLPGLIAQFSGTITRAINDIQSARETLLDYRIKGREPREKTSAEIMPAPDEGPVELVSDDRLMLHRACQFDVVGRRCL
jgi:type II secretory pathway pseudopilin PulG